MEMEPLLSMWSTLLAWLGAGMSFVLAAMWMWWADPSGARRRCPRCWYDMTALPESALICPECGMKASSVRQLRRNRPQRKKAVMAAAVGVTIFMGANWGSIKTFDVRARLPTWVLIQGTAMSDGLENAWWDALRNRATTSPAHAPETPWPLRRVFRQNLGTQRANVSAMLLAKLEAGAGGVERAEAMDLLSESVDVLPLDRLETLSVRELTASNWFVVRSAIRLLRALPPEARARHIGEVSAVVESGATREGDEGYALAAIAEFFGATPPCDRRVLDALSLVFQRPPWFLRYQSAPRASAVRAVIRIGPAAAPLLKYLEGGSKYLGGAPEEDYAVMLLKGELGDRNAVLLHMLTLDDAHGADAWRLRELAAKELRIEPSGNDALWAALRAAFADGHDVVRVAAAETLIARGLFREEALKALDHEAGEADWVVMRVLAEIYNRLGLPLTLLRPHVARLSGQSGQSLDEFMKELEESRIDLPAADD